MALWVRHERDMTNFFTRKRASELWHAWNAKEPEQLPDLVREDASKFLEYFSSKPPKRFALLSLMRSLETYPPSIKPEDFKALMEESKELMQGFTTRSTLVNSSSAQLHVIHLDKRAYHHSDEVLNDLRSRIDVLNSLSFPKRKRAYADAEAKVAPFLDTPEIVRFTISITDAGDASVSPHGANDVQARAIAMQRERETDDTNQEWKALIDYLVTELRDTDIRRVRSVFNLLGEEKTLGNDVSESLRTLLHKLREQSRLHLVPVIISKALEDEHVGEIVRVIRAAEYWKGVFFPPGTIQQLWLTIERVSQMSEASLKTLLQRNVASVCAVHMSLVHILSIIDAAGVFFVRVELPSSANALEILKQAISSNGRLRELSFGPPSQELQLEVAPPYVGFVTVAANDEPPLVDFEWNRIVTFFESELRPFPEHVKLLFDKLTHEKVLGSSAVLPITMLLNHIKDIPDGLCEFRHALRNTFYYDEPFLLNVYAFIQGLSRFKAAFSFQGTCT